MRSAGIKVKEVPTLCTWIELLLPYGNTATDQWPRNKLMRSILVRAMWSLIERERPSLMNDLFYLTDGYAKIVKSNKKFILPFLKETREKPNEKTEEKFKLRKWLVKCQLSDYETDIVNYFIAKNSPVIDVICQYYYTGKGSVSLEQLMKLFVEESMPKTRNILRQEIEKMLYNYGFIVENNQVSGLVLCRQPPKNPEHNLGMKEGDKYNLFTLIRHRHKYRIRTILFHGTSQTVIKLTC